MYSYLLIDYQHQLINDSVISKSCMEIFMYRYNEEVGVARLQIDEGQILSWGVRIRSREYQLSQFHSHVMGIRPLHQEEYYTSQISHQHNANRQLLGMEEVSSFKKLEIF